MGCLRHFENGDRCVLLPEHLVGRSPRAALCLKSNYISAQHASIRWVNTHWELKDLGSRNGTRVNEQPLEAGKVTRLELGMRISFGRAEQTWEFVDETAPRAMVIPLDDMEEGIVIGDMVALPSPEHPSVTIYRRPDGSWKLEQQDCLTTLVDGQVLDVDGRKWRFTCPRAMSNTSTIDWPRFTTGPDLQLAKLNFRVSVDEEHVGLVLSSAGQDDIDLGSRAHNYLLLYLARQRLAELEQGVPDAASGWVQRESLLSALRIDRERLNLDVFRLRRHFALAGVRDAVDVIERRSDTGQLRLGIAQLSIARIGTD